MIATITLLRGLPASGKSHIAKELEQEGYTIVSLDQIRKELGDIQSQQQNMQVLEIALERTKRSIYQGQSVVIDATNVRAAWRKTWYDLARELSCPIYVQRIHTPLLICLIRNWRRERRVPVLKIVQMWWWNLTEVDDYGLV